MKNSTFLILAAVGAGAFFYRKQQGTAPGTSTVVWNSNPGRIPNGEQPGLRLALTAVLNTYGRHVAEESEQRYRSLLVQGITPSRAVGLVPGIGFAYGSGNMSVSQTEQDIAQPHPIVDSLP